MRSSSTTATSPLKVLRLFRLTRMARMARLLRACPELFAPWMEPFQWKTMENVLVEVMLKAIGVALRSVMFALLLQLGLVYVFAIVGSSESS